MTTRVSYTSGGSQFDVTFPYDTKDTVKVLVNGVADTTFTWVNATRIQLTSSAAVGALVEIYRDTAITTPAVQFADGALLPADDLNTAVHQLLYKVQELTDGITTESGRAVRVPLGEASVSIPAIAARANKFLSFDGSGVPTASTPPAGPQGDPGTPGANGADGRTILSGSGAPAGGTGVNGDYYLDTAATRLYGPKTAGAWGGGVSLIGPAGAGSGDMLRANNLSDVLSVSTTLDNLGFSANAKSLVAAANYAAMRTLLGLVIGTNVQAWDADLDTWATVTPSANGKSLVAAADYAAMRTLLGLVIGTNVQAYSANLAAIASDANNGVKPTESIIIAVSDETTALSSGTGKVTFRMPYAFTVTAVRASLTTAQTSGVIFTVDIKESGASILSTLLTIDNTEKTSTTAVTPAVISDAALADDAEIKIDITQIGDGTAKGLKVYLIGHR